MEAEAANTMEDSSLFMQWAMDTLLQEEEPAVDDVHWAMDTLLQEEEEHAAVDGGDAVVFPSLQALRDASHAAEMVRELMAVAAAAETHDAAANSSSSGGSGDGGGEVTDGGSSGATGTDPAAPATTAATDYYGGSWPPQSPTSSSFARAPPPAPPSSNSNTVLPTVSWNFVTGSAQPGSEGVLEEAAVPVPARSVPPPELAQHRRSPPTPPRRAAHPVRSMGAPSSASCTPDHIVAERKRREKINKRLIELSTVIPGLKKMDKATILSDAAKYVKELQQRLKALEDAAAAGAGSIRSKAPAPAADENGGSGSPTSASSSSGAPGLPEIEARFSERSVMVRIHSCGGKGVAAAALAVVEGLGLTVVHANVMPFSACTISITITAEMEGRRLTLTTEQIVGKLKSALSHQRSISCKDAEETEN